MCARGESVKEGPAEESDAPYPILFGREEKGSHIRSSVQFLCRELDVDWLLATVTGY